MDTADEVAARFNERAPHYDGSSMHHALARAVAEFASFEGVRDVLDIATGTGLVLRSLPDDRDLRLVGVDVSDGMLAIARQEMPTAAFVHGDAHALPFADGSFDLVTCVAALHLLGDASSALVEWRRVLRPDGRMVFASFDTSAASAAPVHTTGTTPRAQHEPFGTPDALTAFADTASLVVTRQVVWAYTPEEGTSERCLLTEVARPNAAASGAATPPPAPPADFRD